MENNFLLFLVTHDCAVRDFVNQKFVHVLLEALVFVGARCDHLQNVVLSLYQFVHFLVQLPLVLQLHHEVCLHVIGDGVLNRFLVLDVREGGLSLPLSLEVLDELFYLFCVSGIHFCDMVY